MRTRLFIAALILFFTSQIYGEVYLDSAFEAWLNQPTATGDWCGLRTCLEKRGITISGYYATDIGGNPIGGRKMSSGYSGFLDVGFALDLEKLFCLRGMALRVANYVASGNNLSNSIDNLFCVQEVFAEGNYFFGMLDLSLSLWCDRLTIEIGRLLAGDVFARSELWQYYVSGGLNGSLESIDFNIFFPEYNIAAWATRITYEPTQNWQLVGALYNADPEIEDPDRHGLDFSLNLGKGVLAIGQIKYQHHHYRSARALPGSISLGGYYESSRFQNLSDSTRRHRGNCGFYLVAEQMIFRREWLDFNGPTHLRIDASYAEKVKKPFHQQQVVPHDRPQGLTGWVAAYHAPNDTINIQKYQLGGGLLYRGLFESRKHDVTVFGMFTGKFSDKLKGQEAETVVEVNHRFQMGPWFYITPDIQYVIKPNGQRSIPNALVLNVEMIANF